MTPVASNAAAVHAPAVFQAYLDHLVVERGAAENTMRSYRRDLARYAEHLAALGIGDLAAVAERDVAAFVVGLREGSSERPPLAATSVARTLAAVRGLHRFAHREGTVPVDVARRSTRPPRRAGCPRRCRFTASSN